MTSKLIQKALTVLRCPHCSGDAGSGDAGSGDAGSRESSSNDAQLALLADALQCQRCERRYPIHDGVVDFIPDWKTKPGLAQRYMEHPWIVAIYEDYFRPIFTSLGTNVTYDDERLWLQRIDADKGQGVVLDLATGTGRYARLLADLQQPELVLAVDISLPMLNLGHKKAQEKGYRNILFVRGDAHQLPLANRSIDRANCFGALHLFPDPPRAIAELGRTAKVDAVFTCLTAAAVTSTLKRKLQAGFSRLADFRYFEHEGLRDLLAQAGYSKISFEQFGMLLLFSAIRS